METDEGVPMTTRSRVALVTGGGRGLGAAIATALAAVGMKVAVLARTGPELDAVVGAIEAAGGTAVALPGDVTVRAEVEAAVASAESQLGPLDLLVNDAARFQSLGPTWDVEPEAWWREVQVDLYGPMLCSRAVLGTMLARGTGRIVNIVSGASTVALPGASAYSAAKTALLRLTETMALELEGTGVRSFAVDPGTLRTPMNDELLRTKTDVLERWAPWFLELFAAGREDSIDPAVDLVTAIAGGRADPLDGRLLHAARPLDEQLARAEEIRRDDLLTLRLRDRP